MNVQTDPLQSIGIALKSIFLPMGLKKVTLGWPDTRFFEADGNLPSLFIFNVSDTGKNIVSRETIHAFVTNSDGKTATVYTEKLRKTYLLQLSVFTNTPEDRSNFGWIVEQYLTSNPQIQIGSLGVETAVFTYKGQRSPDDPGETGFYRRDLSYEVTARVLDAQQSVPILKTFTPVDQT